MSLESLDRAVKGTIDLSVGDIIAKYGDTRSIAMAVQRGEIKNVTNAVMAGMAIDRIAANALKPPTTTVAQDTLPMGQAPQTGVAAAQQMQGQPAVAGLDQIPISEGMFTAANGGIVAFESGGTPIERLLKMMNGQERAEYQMTGKIPERLQPRMEGSDARFARQGTGVPMSSAGLAAQGFTPPAAPPRAASNLPSTAQTAAQQAAVQQGTTPLGVEEEFNQDFAMIQRVLGEDPTRARLKALYEKQEKEAEANTRTENAMRLIEAGLAVAGGTSPYAGANFALAAPAVRGAGEDTRARRKEATERAKGMAELEGMTRKEKADILTQTMARRREDKKTQEAYRNQEKLARLQASLKRDAEDVLLDPKSTTEEKQRAREVLTLKRSLGGASSSMPKLSFEDAMKAAESQYGFKWQQMSPEDKAKAADIIYRKYNAGTGTWGEMTVSGGK
jgi:hypothetical protein